ncbi:SEC14-like protein 2 isoform X2 [Uloborus diversus]|uniref:SEC14-like protein 2 isoform X2 n=1 Tax=Uloborus diversus TaxID=327109 RepID=UPI00240A9285|nr:SEC14-like protein 2 isoform X2 [Uloborus diversus]
MPANPEFTNEENESVEELRRRLKDDVRTEMYDDKMMFYRFLKARDFNIDNAEIMLRNHLNWRTENGIDTILKDHKPSEVFQKFLPISFIGYDKEGCIVRYLSVGKADVKGLCLSMKYADFARDFNHLMETDMALLEKQSKALGRRVDKCIYIHDYEGITFGQVSNRRAIQDLIRYFISYQNNYPERLKAVFAINASMYFQFAFSIIKPCLAGTVVEKVHVFGTDGWKEELLNRIDAEQLPAFLGGKRTDPDGNPNCKTFIHQGGIIPESYYIHKSKRSLANAPGTKKVVLSRAAFHEENILVQEPGSLIEWEFETKIRDIGFGLFLHDYVSGEEKVKEIVPLQRIDTEEYAEADVMVFDNTYSWMRSKEIFFKINVIRPNDEKKTENV